MNDIIFTQFKFLNPVTERLKTGELGKWSLNPLGFQDWELKKKNQGLDC